MECFEWSLQVEVCFQGSKITVGKVTWLISNFSVWGRFSRPSRNFEDAELGEPDQNLTCICPQLEQNMDRNLFTPAHCFCLNACIRTQKESWY